VAYYVVVFVAGFAGSFHCVGMCGGFACALGSDSRGVATGAVRHLLYNCGRVTTYAFLGGLAGALGQLICTSDGITVSLMGGTVATAQRVVAIIAGLLMVAMAWQILVRSDGLRRLTTRFAGAGFATALRSLLAARSPAAPLAFGVFNGFLPCPLVYAFVAQAAGTGAALPGILMMTAFGLGTFPAMLLTGGFGHVLAPAWRARGVRIAGAGILLLGLITLGRGLVPEIFHLGHPA